MAGRPQRERIGDALQYVSNAITALRDPDDPDRNGTVALWLSRALIRLKGELPEGGIAAEDRDIAPRAGIGDPTRSVEPPREDQAAEDFFT